MTPLLFLLLLQLLLFIAHVASHPSTPGTCNMGIMSTLGHGPSQSTCKDCYGIKISTDSPHLVNIHITGRFAYQGIVLLVKDKYTNMTLGEFQDFDDTLFGPVACDDDEDPTDYIEPDSLAVLGHVDPKWKQWPINVGWNMVAKQPLTELKLIGMVVIDYDNFHILPETEFKIKRKVIEVPMTSTSIVSITSTLLIEATTVKEMMATHTVIEVEHDAGNLVQQQSNTLFIWVLTVFISLYCLLSTCYRAFTQRRHVNIQPTVADDEISLVVTSNPKDS